MAIPSSSSEFEQLLRVAVDAEGAGGAQLVLAVPAAQQTDAQHPGATCCEEVPHRVADDVALVDRDAEPLLAGEEEVGFGLGAQDVATIDDDHVVRHVEGAERLVDLRSAT